MAFSRNTPYYMISHAGAGKCLNVYGNEQVSNNRNVCLWTKGTGKAQSWSIMAPSGNDKIVSGLSQTYALNYYWSAGKGNPGNCDIYPQAGNDADSCITLSAVNAASNIYKIKLKNYNLYLTAKGTGDNADVRWEAPVSSGTTQQWKLVNFQSTGGNTGGTGSKILPMPSGIRCNWNQKHSGVTSLFGGSACTLVAGLDVGNFYATNGVGYTPASMNTTTYWISNVGYTWQVPGPGAFTGEVFKSANYSQADLRAKAKEQIDAGRPVVIDIGPDGNHSHTMFCYGYKNGAATNEDIYVFDPANLDTSSIEGRAVTLANAMTYNGYSNIRNIRPTYHT